MKRLLCLILAGLLLTGCTISRSGGSGPTLSSWDDPAPITDPAPPVLDATDPTEPPLPAITVTFTLLSDGSKEYGQITGTGEQGDPVWTVTTNRYDVSQLQRVSHIGQWQRQYYFVDDGDVVALDLLTGSELWRNPDFIGAPAGEDACYIAPDGTVYLCGFFGPDLYAISAQGATLLRAASLHDDYFWGHKLIPGDGVITVCFSGGPEGDMGPGAYKVDVPLD